MPASRVLVIEDDLAIRELIVALLRDEGYEVRGAGDGRAGLDHLEWPPDLILLDLMMPVMDGPTFLARQQEIPQRSDIPVIVVSARRDAQPELDAMGIAAMVGKPFDDDYLLEIVAAVLDGAERRVIAD